MNSTRQRLVGCLSAVTMVYVLVIIANSLTEGICLVLERFKVSVKLQRRIEPTENGLGGAIYMELESLDQEHEGQLREALRENCQRGKFDMVFAKKDQYMTLRKLACFDMDSCLLANECIDEMAEVYGKKTQVAELTRRAMNEGLDFNEALKKRLALLEGMPLELLQSVWNRLHFNPGAHRLIQTLKSFGSVGTFRQDLSYRLSFTTAILSGGFTFFACRIGELLGADYVFSNTLEFDRNGSLTGTVCSPIVNGQMKEQIMLALARKLGISDGETVAMGDGANDRWMIARANLGIAYHGKDILRQVTIHHIDYGGVDSALHFLALHSPSEHAPTLPQDSCSLAQLISSQPKSSKQYMPLSELLSEQSVPGSS